MKANVGTTDRALRIFAGSLLILLALLDVIGLRTCPAPAAEDA